MLLKADKLARKTKLLLAMAGTAVVGLSLYLTAQATTFVLPVEAESATLAGSAVPRAGADASGGMFVQFGSQKVQYACGVSNATGAVATREVPVNGAIPNDQLDDYPAIQKAIDIAGNGGGAVVLAAGTYIVDGHLALKDNVKLVGAGSQTIIKAGPKFFDSKGLYGGYPVISTAFSSNTTIASLTVDASGDTLNGNVNGRLTEYIVDLREGSNHVVDNVHTRNPFTYSIVANNTSRFCIKNSSTRSATSGKYDQLDGIHILNSNTGDVVNNDVDQKLGTDGDDGLVAHTINGEVFDVTYAGNKVRGGRHGAHMQFAYSSPSDHIYDIRVLDNYFYGHIGIHTGSFGGSGTVESVLIERNSFMDTPEFSVKLAGTLRDVVVRNNLSCNSGGFIVGQGAGNVNQGNNTNACAIIVTR